MRLCPAMHRRTWPWRCREKESGQACIKRTNGEVILGNTGKYRTDSFFSCSFIQGDIFRDTRFPAQQVPHLFPVNPLFRLVLDDQPFRDQIKFLEAFVDIPMDLDENPSIIREGQFYRLINYLSVGVERYFREDLFHVFWIDPNAAVAGEIVDRTRMVRAMDKDSRKAGL